MSGEHIEALRLVTGRLHAARVTEPSGLDVLGIVTLLCGRDVEASIRGGYESETACFECFHKLVLLVRGDKTPGAVHTLEDIVRDLSARVEALEQMQAVAQQVPKGADAATEAVNDYRAALRLAIRWYRPDADEDHIARIAKQFLAVARGAAQGDATAGVMGPFFVGMDAACMGLHGKKPTYQRVEGKAGRVCPNTGGSPGVAQQADVDIPPREGADAAAAVICGRCRGRGSLPASGARGGRMEWLCEECYGRPAPAPVKVAERNATP